MKNLSIRTKEQFAENEKEYRSMLHLHRNLLCKKLAEKYLRDLDND
jgi:hypothetical protein